MIRQVALAGLIAACIAGMMMGCAKKDSPTAPQQTNLFSEGFETDLSNWQPQYMINVGDNYPQMRITTAAAHTGTHSITADSSRTALLYKMVQIDTLIVGVQFYVMAQTLGHSNFTVEIGQNNGSSGGLGKAFGIGFDQSDSIKCTHYDSWIGHSDTMIAPIQLNHWYKCEVDVDIAAQTISYYLDGAKVRTVPLPTQEWYGLDRVLVFRGLGDFDANGTLIPGTNNSPISYYADDIVLYTK